VQKKHNIINICYYSIIIHYTNSPSFDTNSQEGTCSKQSVSKVT